MHITDKRYKGNSIHSFSLAYGSQSPSPDISADEILVFDMDVVDVKREPGVAAEINVSEAKQQPKKTAPQNAKTIAKPKPKTQQKGGKVMSNTNQNMMQQYDPVKKIF